MVIYVITNKINNKQYVGLTTKTGIKFEKYWGSGKIIKNAIKKHGKENFIKEIVEICDNVTNLCLAEQTWIKNLNSIYPNGYNITVGGQVPMDGFSKMSEIEKSNFFRNRTKNNPDMYNKIKQSRMLSGGYVMSDEQYQQCLIRNKKITQDNGWRQKNKYNLINKNPKVLRYYIQNTITNEISQLINIRGVKSFIFEYNEQMGYKNNKRCNHHLLCHLGYTRDFIMLKKERVNGKA